MAGGQRRRGEALRGAGLAALLCALRKCRPSPAAGEQLPVGSTEGQREAGPAGGSLRFPLAAAAGAGAG